MADWYKIIMTASKILKKISELDQNNDHDNSDDKLKKDSNN